jgi:hypothetical protein
MVLNSAKNYTRLIEQPCIPMKGINDDFAWGSNLNRSPFEECAPSLFSIILNMNENGAFYSSYPDKFEVCCLYGYCNQINFNFEKKTYII